MDTLGWLLPDGISLGVATLLIVASAFTSALTASFGLGGGTAMLALLGLFTPVSLLIPVHGAVQFGSNSGRAWHRRADVRLDVALPFILGSIFGAIAGYFIVVQLPDAVMKIVLGGFILLITWFSIPGIGRLSKVGLAIASSGIAILSMMVGVTGAIVSPMMAQFIPNDRKALVATNALAVMFQHGLKVVVFALAGVAFGQWLPMVVLMIASGYLGTVYGSKLLDRMPEHQFRIWFKLVISALALDLLRRGIMVLF